MNHHGNLLSMDAYLFDARNRFFPGWWTGPSAPSSGTRPLYRVACNGLADCTLAREARPDRVRAMFKLSATTQKRLDELMEKNSQGILRSSKEQSELRDLVRATEELLLANAEQLLDSKQAA